MRGAGNILVLTQWSFKDALIQTYTLPYIDIIREITSPERKIILVTAEKAHIGLNKEEIDQINQEWKEKNMQLLPEPYKRFGIEKLIAAALNLSKLIGVIKKERIKTIHAFCTPAGSIGYLLSKLSGAKLIIDSYEPHATAMVEAGAWKKNGASFKILFALEKKLSQRASYIIATTAGMKQYALENYGIQLSNFFVKPACINFEDFYPRPKDKELTVEFGIQDKVVCVYAGKLGGTYLKEEVFDFIKACYEYWQEDFRFLMLTGESNRTIEAQIKRVGLPGHIIIKRYVEHKNIPRYLSVGDFGINPQVPVPSKRFGSPIKNGEYWAMGLPVVISPNISDDSDIIVENEIGVVINLQQTGNMALAVRKMDTLLKATDRTALQEKIFSVATRYRSFNIPRRIYPVIYKEAMV